MQIVCLYRRNQTLQKSVCLKTMFRNNSRNQLVKNSWDFPWITKTPGSLSDSHSLLSGTALSKCCRLYLKFCMRAEILMRRPSFYYTLWHEASYLLLLLHRGTCEDQSTVFGEGQIRTCKRLLRTHGNPCSISQFALSFSVREKQEHIIVFLWGGVVGNTILYNVLA